jgi:small conductance mechanosensitive channel
MLSYIKGVVTIYQEYLEPIKVNILNWLTPANLQALLISLALAAAVMAGTYVLIKVANLILDRVLRESFAEGAESEGSFFSSGMVQSLRTLMKILILYGGYFLAAILILGIFEVKVITPDDLKQVGTNLLKIIGVIVGSRLIVSFGGRAIKQIFERRELNDNLVDAGRLQTLEVLLRSTFTYLIYFMAGLTILQIFNVNTAAILASAGILGLAVGFGAQSLVRDIISGFFIIFEDQFKVGDFVEAVGVIGVVEEVGLRTCKIRQWTGQLHVIPNGEITKVTNYSRGCMMAVVMVGI